MCGATFSGGIRQPTQSARAVAGRPGRGAAETPAATTTSNVVIVERITSLPKSLVEGCPGGHGAAIQERLNFLSREVRL
jgi:hypothetical protein